MDIRTKCSHCEKEYTIKEELLGNTAKCSACEQNFVITHLDNLEGGVKTDNSTTETKEEGVKKVEVKKEAPMRSEDLEFKPHKLSYIFLGNPLIILGILFAIFMGIANIFAGLIVLMLPGLMYVLINIKYKKEKYTLTDRKIIFHYGNIISDNSVEVNLDKVTQVKSILGFVQNKIFGTGHVIVNTAGSSSSKIKLSNIDTPMDIYEEVQKRMQKNGFNLEKNKLVQSAKPHWLGVIGEVFKKVLTAIAIFAYFVITMQAELAEQAELGSIGGYIIGIAGVFLLITLLPLVFKYLDLKRREYNIFTDTIEYTEGFLTKQYSVLPMESVADTENTQSFFSKIFGLHDIVVSSQGSNNQVVFKNMTDGEKMMENIKYLKNSIIPKEKTSTTGKENVESSNLVGYTDQIEEPLDYDSEFTGEYKMSMLKAMILILPTIITGPGIILFAIAQFIRVKFTRYIVGNSSIEKKFNFFSNKHNSFSVEKITGVIIRESLLDKVLRTCSVTFWSLGSSADITFRDIKKTEGLYEELLAKVGIKNEEGDNLKIDFSFMNFIKKYIGYFIFLGIVVILYIILFVVLQMMGINIIADGGIGQLMIFLLFIISIGVHYIFEKFYYSSRFYSQTINNKHIYSKQGIFFQTKSAVLYRNIKGITAKKYPLTSTGTLTLNVAGEQVVETKQKKKFSLLSNKISVPYLGNVFTVQNHFDTILNSGDIDETLVESSKQDIGNSIFGTVIFFTLAALVLIGNGLGIVLIPLLVFAGISIGIRVWIIKVKYYNFEKSRVLFGSGIIYKKRQTILYPRFNFIEAQQGFINKIFRNGAVNIYTLGSGKVEMKIIDADNYKDVYELLKKD